MRCQEQLTSGGTERRTVLVCLSGCQTNTVLPGYVNSEHTPPPSPPPDDGFIDKALIVVSTAEITSQQDDLPCSCVYIHVDVCLFGYFCLCICVIVCLPVYSCVCVGACVGACQSAGLSGNSRHPSTPADGRQQSSAPRGGQSNIHHDVSLQ